MTIHLASGENLFLDFREKAPLKATATIFQDESGNVVKGRSTGTWLGIGTPGTVMGLNEALKRYGTMPLAEVIARAVRVVGVVGEAEGRLPELRERERVVAVERDRKSTRLNSSH